ncbi:MAG: FAD-dependent oxidoreductase, partial [Gammaproteobacteria bacterium]
MIDVAIIGAGIHGAGIALSAAAAGYSVRLLEQFDSPAQGTSSRSSKLIHGGLRYLATGQFVLVRECLRERRILLHNAPDLVRLVPFYIPIYKPSLYQPSWVAAGLSLYALLGGLRAETRFAWVPRKEWNALDGLNPQQLCAVFRYFDAQTDDALLTRAVLSAATNLGAEIRFGSKVTSIRLRPRACDIHFENQGRSQSCQARVVINATGPWV